MKIDKQKEDAFYAQPFSFSYSSINKLMFSPTLFYKDYILKDREIRTDKHLIEGKLLHCLMFEPEKLSELFDIVPEKVPSENIKKILKNITLHTDALELGDVKDFIILDSLKEENLYQSLKTDESRIDKVRTLGHGDYYEFLQSTGKDIIDNETLQKCTEKAAIIQNTKSVMQLFNKGVTDFELDTLEIYKEKPLECKLNDFDFGLKGIIDYYDIDHEAKTITIVDLKTTARTLEDFSDSIDYYNYWLQAAIYIQLVLANCDEKCEKYKILFNFVVIDKYNQVYTFVVSPPTLKIWRDTLVEQLLKVEYHYKEKKYNLPYEFSNGLVYL